MALSPEDIKEIVSAIKSELHTNCECGLNQESQREMGHFFGRVKDLGDGNLNKGIEIFSKAAFTMISIRRYGEKIGGAVAVFLFVALASGILTAIGIGVRAIITKE